MAAVFEVEEKDARKLLSDLDYSGVAKMPIRKVTDRLAEITEGNDEDDMRDRLDKKSFKLFNRISQALAAEKKIKVAEMNGDTDEDEEEEKPARKKVTKKAPAKKAKAKKAADEDEDEEEDKPKKKKAGKKRASSGGGPTPKDKIFNEWVKDPVKFKKNIKKIIDRYDGTIAATTIRKWTGRWSKQPMGVGYPRLAEGREPEIKKALKMLKAAK